MRDEGPAPVADPIWLTRNVVIRAGGTGLFYPSVHCGDVVAEGAGLGRVTDFHGRVVEDIHAPLGCEVLYVVATPPVTKGEPLAMVAATGRTPDARPSRP